MNVYISHSGQDNRLAAEVSRVLHQAGMEAWDASHILPGENWAEATADALRNSDAMVVLLTPESARSKVVQSDVGFALGQPDFKDRVISVVAGPPGLFEEDFPWVLKRLPRIELDPDTGDFAALGELPALLSAV
jgi:TIR domain